MGYHNNSFAAAHVFTEIRKKPWFKPISDREQWIEDTVETIWENALDAGKTDEEADKLCDEFNDPEEFQIAEWRLQKDQHGQRWEYKTIDGVENTIMRKGNHVVYVVNSAMGREEGDIELTFWADDLETLKQFRKDVGLSTQIKSPGVVESWYYW